MKTNPVKRKVLSGGVSIGTFMFEFDTTGIARIAAQAGAEFAVFDMEHSGWSVETIRMLLATTPMQEIVPLVRVPTTEYDFIARILDVGAMGIMVPMVETAAQASLVASSAKYPPVGRRGAAFGVSHDDYAGGDIVAKMNSGNNEGLLIAQIETAAGVRHVDEIAAVPGIDVLWIGHYDLSISMGIPGQFDSPQFLDAVARVLEACRRHGKVPGMMCGDIAGGTKLLDQGFRMIAYGGDLWLYQSAVREGVAALQKHAPASRTSK